MAEDAGKLEHFVSHILNDKKTQPIEQLLLSLEDLPSLMGVSLNEEIFREIRRKLYKYKGLSITKEQMKKILEVIVDPATKTKIHLLAIEDTIKENTHVPGFDASNTIVIGDKDEETTQYEFKSIMEDVGKGIETLEQKTEIGLNLDLGPADTFITERKSERQKRAEELNALRDTREALPKISFDTYKTAAPLQMPENRADRCTEILTKINGIIGQKERHNTSTAHIRRIESYETTFNQKVLSLLNELTEKLDLSHRTQAPQEPRVRAPPAEPPTVTDKTQHREQMQDQNTAEPNKEEPGTDVCLNGSQKNTLDVSALRAPHIVTYVGVGCLLGLLVGLYLKSPVIPY